MYLYKDPEFLKAHKGFYCPCLLEATNLIALNKLSTCRKVTPTPKSR